MFATNKESKKDAALDKIGEDVARLKGDARRAASEMKDELGTMAHEAGQHARKIIDTASETAKTEISSATTAIKTQIREKPIQSGLIALGVGVVLGALLRR
ncbi:MAG: hypothetical protein PHY92_00435 [Alphaproteobacteria bacterium]|nr:hypothetical protein [Alphaproteobacteria bacterium]